MTPNRESVRVREEPMWTDWPGGFNNPIDLTVIETKLRNGTTRRVYAHLVKWTHDQSPFDVVAYRLIKAEEKAE